MAEQSGTERRDVITQYAPIAGVILVVAGLLFLLDQRIHTNWLSLSIPVVISLVLISAGFILRRSVLVYTGWILLGLGGALFFLLQNIFDATYRLRIGLAMFANAIAWIGLFIAGKSLAKRTYWWVLFLVAIFLGLGYLFSIRTAGLLDYIWILSLAISLVFLAWGLFTRKIALIIPGALLATIGTGVYVAWSEASSTGGLKDTGIMLVWFALGWILVTILSRVIEKRFLWWPLIPGGVLLTVGTGLYIGGDPENTLGFLGNTGSIGLILLGVYLILLKFGIKK